MRLWSIHPKYLDSKGLVALWREALLAQKVLAGGTRGYKNHPQLDRFKKAKDPLGSLGAYLKSVAEEATLRKYRFDDSKILKAPRKAPILAVTRGQLRYETAHLLKKLELRDPARFKQLADKKTLQPHPLFFSIPGPLEAWERTL